MLKVYRVGRNGNAEQLILSMLDNDRVVFFTAERMPGIRPLPFARSAHVRLGPNGRVYAGRNDSLSISITNQSGQLEGMIRLHLQLEPVTRAEIQESLSGRDASSRQEIRDAGIPRTKPAYNYFTVDDQGRVWVKGRISEDDTYAPWLILDQGASVVGEALLPRKVGLRAIKSGRAYAISSEESGAPIVIVYEIDHE